MRVPTGMSDFDSPENETAVAGRGVRVTIYQRAIDRCGSATTRTIWPGKDHKHLRWEWFVSEEFIRDNDVTVAKLKHSSGFDKYFRHKRFGPPTGFLMTALSFMQGTRLENLVELIISQVEVFGL